MWWKAQVFSEIQNFQLRRTSARYHHCRLLFTVRRRPPLPLSTTQVNQWWKCELALVAWDDNCFLLFLNISRVGGATYLQLPTGLPTVLPNGLILATTKPKGSHKSYSEKRRCHEEPKISIWKRGVGSSIRYITFKCKVRPAGGVPQQPAASTDSRAAQRACRRVCRGSAWIKVVHN